jgi:hypothetical protein
MTPPRECKERFEDIVALVISELNPAAARELQSHIAVCDRCRALYDALTEEEKEVRSGFEAIARSLGPVEQAVRGRQHHPSRVRVNASHNHFLERVKNMILAHKRLSVAAALVMALAASVILYVSMVSFSAPAYALEQTVQANKHVTSYHVKITPAAELDEAWVQLNPDGTPLRARMDFLSPDDGPKVVVLSGEKAEVWFKKKNSFVTVRDKDALNRLMKMRALFDPKLAFDDLQVAQRAPTTQVVTKEPAKEGEPVTLTATSEATGCRKVFEVDPKTKLVQRVTIYRRHGQRWEQLEQREYLDYNKEIDAGVFQPELPKDVIRIDQTQGEIGLAKGSLTDNEIATKVVKEFFEALIAEDYKKAGMICSGIPAEKMKEKEMFGRYKFFRIVEIGKPAPHSKTSSLQVPVKVESELEGKKAVRPFLPLARQVYGQPDRWEIISVGGI